MASKPFTSASRVQVPAAVAAHQNQFCSLLVTQYGYKPQMTMQLDYDEGIGLSTPLAAQMKEEAAYVNSLTTIADVLSFLGLKG